MLFILRSSYCNTIALSEPEQRVRYRRRSSRLRTPNRTPKREGMVDPTGLSFAQPKGGLTRAETLADELKEQHSEELLQAPLPAPARDSTPQKVPEDYGTELIVNHDYVFVANAHLLNH